MKLESSIVLLCFLALASCNVPQRIDFELENKTAHVLLDVRIRFGNVIVRRDSLGPGETFAFHPSPNNDGGIEVSYVEGAKRLERKLGYVAPPISMRCKFLVVDNDLRGNCIQN